MVNSLALWNNVLAKNINIRVFEVQYECTTSKYLDTVRQKRSNALAFVVVFLLVARALLGIVNIRSGILND